MARLIHVKDFNVFELHDMLEGTLLELLIDTTKEWDKAVFHVHPPMGHAKAAAQYLRIDEDELTEDNAGHLIPAIVEIKEVNGIKTVTQVMIGRSSLEMGTPVNHKKHPAAKREAKKIVDKIMHLSEQIGEVVLAENLKEHEYVFK